jgi:[acyl-carrier-protein] S-malonyltransferase
LTQHYKSAYIFPAFINEYPKDPFGGLEDLENHFQSLLSISSSLIDIDLAEFNFISNDFLGDELKTQYLTYIYSCAAADILDKKKLRPAYSAGYSMGIYAALVHAGVTTFSDGLLLIRKAYETIRNAARDEPFGMCSVIGLDREDLARLIRLSGFRVEITNQNSNVAFVLSGWHEDILELMKAATAEGALHTHLLNVSLPYHSRFLKESGHTFRDFLETMLFANPRTGIISLIDQHIVQNKSEIKEELIKNLFTPLNWYQTQLELIRSGVTLFVECGPGKNLERNSKFIEGEYQFSGLSGFLKLSGIEVG